MTNDEAIEILNNTAWLGTDNGCRNHVNAEYCRKCGQAIDWSDEDE